MGIRGGLQAGLLRLSEERMLHKDVEIFAVGKIAESARFSEEEDESLQSS